LIDAGNLVKANDPGGLVVITQIDPAAVFFTIPQDRLPAVSAAIAKGDVAVEVWNRDGTTMLATGKVAVLDNQINQTTATLRLKALVPNADRKLWPNAFVKARMLVETRANALVIPAVAIQRGPQGAFVYVVGDDKTAQLRAIEVGTIVGDNATVMRGLEAGQKIVVEGASQLRPGGKVSPIETSKDKGSGTPTSQRQPGGT
jgi:multidrug efflux system membrane fusion protein